jgi:hypothetical protein
MECANGMVAALPSFRLEQRLVVEVSPRVIGPNLVGSTRNANHTSTISEPQR